MIFKAYELEKVNLKEIKYFLLYGENQGHKSEIIEKNLKVTSQKVLIHMKKKKFSIIEKIFLMKF